MIADPQRPSVLKVALAWLPAFSYTALIWWLSSQALQVDLIDDFPLRDKGVHFLEYAGLGLCICFAVYTTWPGRGARAALAAVLITTALGLTDELHQAFVPGRSADVLDLAADFLGASAAATFYAVVHRWRQRRRARGLLAAAPPPNSPPSLS